MLLKNLPAFLIGIQFFQVKLAVCKFPGAISHLSCMIRLSAYRTRHVPGSRPGIEQTGQSEVAVDQKEVVDISRCYRRIVGDSGGSDMHVKAATSPTGTGIQLPKCVQRSTQHHFGEHSLHVGCHFQDAKFTFEVGNKAVEQFIFGRGFFANVFDAEIELKVNGLRYCRLNGRKDGKPVLDDRVALSVKDFADDVGVEYIQQRPVPDIRSWMKTLAPVISKTPFQMAIG